MADTSGLSNRTSRREFLRVVGLGAAASIAAACAPAAPSPTQAPTKPAAAPSSTQPPVKAAAAPVSLTTHVWGAARVFTKGYEWWADEVTKKTGGAVTFKHFYSESLGKATDQVDNVRAGLFDVGMISVGYTPGKLPLHQIISLPLLSKGPLSLTSAYWDMLEVVPEFRTEIEAFGKPIIAAPVAMADYMGKVPIRQADDFKGKRIRTWAEFTKLVSLLGGVPVSMTHPEAYDALSKGVLDGVLSWWTDSFASYSIHEVAKQATLMQLGSTFNPVLINWSTWNKLSPDVQKIMVEVGRDAAKANYALFEATDEKNLEKFKQARVEIFTLPAAERAKIVASGRPIWDEWTAEVDKKGLPGKKLLDAYVAAIQKYEK